MAFTGNFVYMAHGSSCYGSIPLTLRLLRRDGGLSTLASCHSCEFPCQEGELKPLPGSRIEHGKGLTMAFTGKFMCVCIYIYIYIYNQFNHAKYI